ncbi:hypothetical protein [Alloalcanivorax xenomutans]|uniref:hypothetical protein n=1 Tax=Alloalcanivorax xenomutans TaxID=1094342 RepID=UPI003C7A6DDD
MLSFPLMNDLPQSVSTFGWSWERFVAPYGSSENFWLGTDREGNRWLTKLRGPFYAYREIVFARLAQAMNWSCQSSVFLNLDPVSASVLGVKPDITHAAHWFMPEHKRQLCSGGCAVKFLFDKEIRTVDDLVGSQIEHLLDWPKSEFAAFLFGANEPPGRLFTTAHEFVIIDSEQMFSSGPCDFDTASWWNAPNGEPSLSGRMLAEQVCADLLSLSERDIKDALSIPKGIEVRENWPIAPIIRASRKFAVSFDGL